MNKKLLFFVISLFTFGMLTTIDIDARGGHGGGHHGGGRGRGGHGHRGGRHGGSHHHGGYNHGGRRHGRGYYGGRGGYYGGRYGGWGWGPALATGAVVGAGVAAAGASEEGDTYYNYYDNDSPEQPYNDEIFQNNAGEE